MEPYIGQIQLFSFDFAPKGWDFCDGRLLSIAQNSALFSLISTTYGGDGVTTFALPDLRGRVPIGFRQGPGLSSYVMGEESDTESVTRLSTQMPAHNHLMMVSAGPAMTLMVMYWQSPTDQSPAGANRSVQQRMSRSVIEKSCLFFSASVTLSPLPRGYVSASVC